MNDEPTITESMDAEQARRQRMADALVNHYQTKRAQVEARARRERLEQLATSASNIWRKLTRRK